MVTISELKSNEVHIKDTGYDSTDTDENTLYDGYDNPVNPNNLSPFNTHSKKNILSSSIKNGKNKNRTCSGLNNIYTSTTTATEEDDENASTSSTSVASDNNKEEIIKEEKKGSEESEEIVKTLGSEDLTKKDKKESETSEEFNVIEAVREEIALSKTMVLRLQERKLDVILNPIFHIIYIIIHTLYEMYLNLLDYFVKIQNSYFNKTLKVNPSTLTECTRKLEKIPKHIAVVLDLPSPYHHQSHIPTTFLAKKNNDQVIQKVVEVIQWSIEVGIPFITFYDRHGNFKANIDNILNSFPNEIEVPNTSSPSNFTLQFCSSGNLIEQVLLSNSYKKKASTTTSSSFPTKFVVNFIDYDDGKPIIAKVTKSLIHELSPATIEQMTVEELDQAILTHSGELVNEIDARDPNLILVFGGSSDYFKLYSYPPWQLRLSEIFYIPGKSEITYYGYLSGLYRYSKCEQRVGK